jgi:subfamily B ATP-binding cassette protein MsbA
MIVFLRKVWGFVTPYRSRLLLGLFFGALFAISNALLMLVIKFVPDLAFAPQHQDLAARIVQQAPEWIQGPLERWFPSIHSPASRAGMALVIGLLPMVMAVRGLSQYLNVYLTNWAATRSVADLRHRLFCHLQSLPLAFFDKSRTGNLISRIMSDTHLLHQTISNSLPTIVRDPLTILALIILLFSQQPALTLVSLIVFPVTILPVVIYGRKIRKSAAALQSHIAELSHVMHESFSGNRIVKAYNLEPTMSGRFAQSVQRMVSAHMRILRSHETPGPIIEFLASVGVAMVFVYVMTTAVSSRPTPGDMLQFIGSIFMMYQPIKAVGRLQTQLEQARAATAHVFELLDTRSDLTDPVSPKPLKAAGADVVFERVSFSFGEKMVLRDINLRVKAGSLVALVGSSGSGKTTLTNLLLRFYDPQTGAVRIGDTDIREVAMGELRRQIALVSQENLLFNESIRQNIGLGRPGATPEEIEHAARHAFAHDFIMQKPGGYESSAGEKGTSLSAGQRQRISIARAILKDSPILVLDEATSALDSESERAVQAALEELTRGRTTICIAHRLSTIQKADLIVVMDQGQIVETGTHAELVGTGGLYSRLSALQSASRG